MNVLASKLLEQFERTTHVGLSDAPDRFVAVYLPRGGLVVSGIGEGMPPFVAFQDGRLWVAADPSDWIEVTKEETFGFQVLTLLDPRVILKLSDDVWMNESMDDVEKWTAHLDLKRLPLMMTESLEGVAAHGKEHKVDFVLQRGYLTEMVQPDIAPSMAETRLRILPLPSPLPWSSV